MKEENQRVSTFSQILLWFGAAISIAEIITGALLAPLGLIQGIWAIILGHIIGGVILFPAGLIGAKSGLSSAESIRISFGKYDFMVYWIYGLSFTYALQFHNWNYISCNDDNWCYMFHYK